MGVLVEVGALMVSSPRWPPFQVVPFGSAWMVRCAECGDLKQVGSVSEGRHEGRDHQRWEHPTDEEREQDDLRDFETYHMDGTCPRCGHDGHDGDACPTVTPDLLKNWGS